LTLFQQIVAGDSWGLVSIPLIKEFPEMAIILFMIMMTVSLGVMNLILAVIVERASEARANDQERKLKKKEQDRAKNMVELAKLCASMDADGSGALSLEEMLAGYDDDVGEFRKLMQLMDIQRDDITSIFE
ncbi:prodh, partial [Symbiodinium sp. CCMP2456]